MQTDPTFFTTNRVPRFSTGPGRPRTFTPLENVDSQTNYTVNATNNNLRNAAGGRRVAAVFSNGVKYFDILVGFFRTGAETLVSGAEFGSCENA